VTAYNGCAVIGVDPGPVPGIVLLSCGAGRVEGVEAYQCTADSAAGLLERLTPTAYPAIIQVEAFVVRRVSGKSGHAGRVTRDLVGQLEHAASGWPNGHVTFVQQSAAQVKPWATDTRLKAVKVHGTDLLDLAGHVGRHARDAARHALYAAVKHGAIPDPLSTRKD
jgi:hypothetical protein